MVGGFFHVVDGFLCCTEAQFDIVFDVISFGFWSQIQKKKKTCEDGCERACCLCSRSFMVSGFTFKSLVWFELTFVSDVRQ